MPLLTKGRAGIYQRWSSGLLQWWQSEHLSNTDSEFTCLQYNLLTPTPTPVLTGPNSSYLIPILTLLLLIQQHFSPMMNAEKPKV